MFVVGPGGFADGRVSHAPGSVVEGGCGPLDASALDVDCAVLMWLTYRRHRRRLLRRLSAFEEQTFQQIIREFSENALLVMWGLKPRPIAVKPKPKSNYAELLNAEIARNEIAIGGHQPTGD